MHRISYETVLKALNAGKTGDWFSFERILDLIETQMGRSIDRVYVRDTFLSHLQEAVRVGHAMSETHGNVVRYHMTPKGQDWLTKHS